MNFYMSHICHMIRSITYLVIPDIVWRWRLATSLIRLRWVLHHSAEEGLSSIWPALSTIIRGTQNAPPTSVKEKAGNYQDSGDSLSGRFFKEGEDFPLWGFLEPWYDHLDKKIKSGMEILFLNNYSWANECQYKVQPLIDKVVIVVKVSKESDYTYSFNLQTLGLTLYDLFIHYTIRPVHYDQGWW